MAWALAAAELPILAVGTGYGAAHKAAAPEAETAAVARAAVALYFAGPKAAQEVSDPMAAASVTVAEAAPEPAEAVPKVRWLAPAAAPMETAEFPPAGGHSTAEAAQPVEVPVPRGFLRALPAEADSTVPPGSPTGSAAPALPLWGIGLQEPVHLRDSAPDSTGRRFARRSARSHPAWEASPAEAVY